MNIPPLQVRTFKSGEAFLKKDKNDENVFSALLIAANIYRAQLVCVCVCVCDFLLQNFVVSPTKHVRIEHTFFSYRSREIAEFHGAARESRRILGLGE